MIATPPAQTTAAQPSIEGSAQLVCLACGGVFHAARWQPRLRCPHCATLGYPDRAGRHLLSLAWECPTCGATNEGLFNFCLQCGAGLPSRCLRCERPVYSAVCLHCGAHQARLLHLRRLEERRLEWVPILREHVEQARIREEWEANRRHDPLYGVREWRAVDGQMRKAAAQRQQRHAAGRSRWAAVWGWVVLIVGVAWLLGANHREVAALARSLPASLDPAIWFVGLQSWYHTEVGPLVGAVWAFLQGWWAALSLTFSHPPAVDEPEYAYLFASFLFGLALLPVLLYLLGRLVRRLFP